LCLLKTGSKSAQPNVQADGYRRRLTRRYAAGHKADKENPHNPSFQRTGLR